MAMNRNIHFIELVAAATAAVVVAGCSDADHLGPVADSRAALAIRDAISSGVGGGAEAGATGPVGTGWATLRGRFIYDGTPPQMEPYNVSRDYATCSPGGQAPLQETLVVDSGTRGIKDIAVYLRRASRVHESAAASDQAAVFDQKNCIFQSHVFPMFVGQSIEFKNSDPVGHNTKIAGRNNSFNQIIPANGSLNFVAQREEATPADTSCSIHPWMKAYVLPRENGYVAVTADDGSFEIANLPADEELEFQVWHESAASSSGVLSLSTPEAKTLKWSSKGRFKITLEPDATREIELVVPASAFRG